MNYPKIYLIWFTFETIKKSLSPCLTLETKQSFRLSYHM